MNIFFISHRYIVQIFNPWGNSFLIQIFSKRLSLWNSVVSIKGHLELEKTALLWMVTLNWTPGHIPGIIIFSYFWIKLFPYSEQRNFCCAVQQSILPRWCDGKVVEKIMENFCFIPCCMESCFQVSPGSVSPNHLEQAAYILSRLLRESFSLSFSLFEISGFLSKVDSLKK